MSFLLTVLGSITLLLVVTRVAGRRDAERKAALARRADAERSDRGG